MIEVVLGHCTYCALLNRSLMSVFCDSYTSLFGGVKIRAHPGASPAVHGGLDPRVVSASDASLAGYGVCTRKLPRGVVGGLGRVPERERFRQGPALGARAAALVEGTMEDADDEDISCANLIPTSRRSRAVSSGKTVGK